MLNRTIQIALAMLIGIPTYAAAAGIVQLPATGQISCFDANNVKIVCNGTTGQDGDTRGAGVAWPAPRFIANGVGAMTDNLTGLTWTKHANAPELALGLAFCTPATPGPENDMTWPQSIDYINCLNGLNGVGYLGFNDWRLPNVNELESMVNAEVADTAGFLNANGFGLGTPNSPVQSSQYWTSTTDASNLPASLFATLNAWDMDLAKGQSFSSDKTDPVGTKAVWPVRGISAGPAKIWRTGQDVCFDLAGDPIPCAGTGQDGEKLSGAAWSAPRFKASLDNTLVLDRVTGLVWTRNTNTPGPLGGACPGTGLPAGLSWLEALTHTACLNTSNFLGLQPNPAIGNTGWRIPNRKELRSLVDYSRGGPALPALHPFTDTLGLTYWSSTTDAFVPIQAWSVSMLDGSLSGSNKTGTFPAWPVSGPDLVAPVLIITQGNMTTNVASQTISGTVEAGATVTVAVNGGAPAAAAVIGATWSLTLTLAEGVNSVAVTAADFSENLSTAAISITLDTIAPALAITQGNMTTNVASQTISGTVEAGATMTVAINGGAPAAVTPTGATWSLTINPLATGVNTVTVTAADIVGNLNTASISITLDTIAPTLALSQVPSRTNKKNLIIAGTVEAGTTVAAKLGETALPVTVNSTIWSFPVNGLAIGANTITVTATDAVGNATPQVATLTFTPPDGIISGGSVASIADALKALRIAVGIVQQSADDLFRGDVAPLGAPDDRIDAADALLILKKAVGLPSY